jgi:hypothetical protein
MSSRWARFGVLAIVVTLVLPATTFAGDAFVKLGINLATSQDMADLGGFADRWFFSGGTEWGWIEERGFVGFDIQTAVHSMDFTGGTVRVVPFNLFGTVKWKSAAQTVRPYAGGGVGLMSQWVKVEDTMGNSAQDYFSDTGMEFMGGVEFDRKFVTEFMGQKVFQDGAPWLYSVLFGYRF